MGRAMMVKKDWIKPGATVIDVGVNFVPDETKKTDTYLSVSLSYEFGKED